VYLTLTEQELRRAAGEDPERALELLEHHVSSLRRHRFRGVWWESPDAMRRRLLLQAEEWERMLREEFRVGEPVIRRRSAAMSGGRARAREGRVI
jgi:hypothetical protein